VQKKIHTSTRLIASNVSVGELLKQIFVFGDTAIVILTNSSKSGSFPGVVRTYLTDKGVKTDTWRRNKI